MLSSLSSLSHLNPLLLLALAATSYGLFAFVRSQAASLAAVAIGIACLSFLALPSGLDSLRTAQHLPDRLARIRCLAAAVSHGAPLSRGAARRADACRFTGLGIGKPQKPRIRELLSASRDSLTDPR